MMKKLAIIFLFISLAAGCSLFRKTPQANETRVEYIYKDSIVVKDCVRVVDLPVERIVDAVAVYDTLELETSLAKARAYVDTTNHTLKGSIENKERAKLKIEYRDRLIYRDSIYTKEVPVPYEVEIEKVRYPITYWPLLVFFLMILGKNAPKMLKLITWLKTFKWEKLIFWKKKNPKS